MKFLLEFKNYYKEGDIVLIEYWYNDMVTPVKILNKTKHKYEITHNIPESQIFNAPNEFIKVSDIIDHFRG